jgi:hypothetical protein
MSAPESLATASATRKVSENDPYYKLDTLVSQSFALTDGSAEILGVVVRLILFQTVAGVIDGWVLVLFKKTVWGYQASEITPQPYLCSRIQQLRI